MPWWWMTFLAGFMSKSVAAVANFLDGAVEEVLVPHPGQSLFTTGFPVGNQLQLKGSIFKMEQIFVIAPIPRTKNSSFNTRSLVDRELKLPPLPNIGFFK